MFVKIIMLKISMLRPFLQIFIISGETATSRRLVEKNRKSCRRANRAKCHRNL